MKISTLVFNFGLLLLVCCSTADLEARPRGKRAPVKESIEIPPPITPIISKPQIPLIDKPSLETPPKNLTFRDLSFNLWSSYIGVDFDTLSSGEKTQKLQDIFYDQYAFIKRHKTPRLIVKILNPLEFDFFHPDHFDSEKEDNFYFWALKMSHYTSIEALFDSSSFQLTSDSMFDHLIKGYELFREIFGGEEEEPFGNFKNIGEKMEWVAFTNRYYDAKRKNRSLISGITLDPQGIGPIEAHYQNVVNAFDQFRFKTGPSSKIPSWIPENPFSKIRLGMILPLEMKNFALANGASFPLYADLRSESNQKEIGIKLPENFPSHPPKFSPPFWRASVYRIPLLDTIYLNLADPRLLSSVYQNKSVLPHPEIVADSEKISSLAKTLGKVFHGTPLVQGPGNISSEAHSCIIKGNYTFFHTGSPSGEGQLLNGCQIEIHPPYVAQTILRETTSPESNRKIGLSSPLSLEESVDEAEYWICPVPCNWQIPRISNILRSRLYFVFSTTHTPQKECFFGNWNLQNFLNFVAHDPSVPGFIHLLLFRDLKGALVRPKNNLVLYDFSTLPNGTAFPELDWNLGNQSH
jgi:hypothetical protein